MCTASNYTTKSNAKKRTELVSFCVHHTFRTTKKKLNSFVNKNLIITNHRSEIWFFLFLFLRVAEFSDNFLHLLRFILKPWKILHFDKHALNLLLCIAFLKCLPALCNNCKRPFRSGIFLTFATPLHYRLSRERKELRGLATFYFHFFSYAINFKAQNWEISALKVTNKFAWLSIRHF